MFCQELNLDCGYFSCEQAARRTRWGLYIGDFYSVKNLDGKVKTVYFAHGWQELGREEEAK